MSEDHDNTVRLLIAETDRIVARDLELILQSQGFSILGVPSAVHEVISQVEDEKPDLILMDVVMPGMNGFQASREITTNPDTSSIPVIIVSTKDQETDKLWGLRQGAKDYITKPAKEKDLIGKINTLLGN